MEERPSTPARTGGQRYRTPSGESSQESSGNQRRRRFLSRTFPLVVLSTGSFALGAVIGGSGDGSAAGQRFADAWERQDFTAMHAELTASSRKEFRLEKFTELYVDAQATATAVRVATGETESGEREGGEAAVFSATVDTRAFGQVSGRVELPLDGEGKVEWQPHLTFPGLAAEESLDRETTVGERAPLLAADGTPLAEGPASARTSPLGASALAIAGALGSPSRKQERDLYALGFPPGSLAGTSGLELAFNTELAGQPSGQLLAVSGKGGAREERILASGDPLPGTAVKTTIDPKIQSATVAALGSLYGGVAVLDASSGDVVGVAGLAFSAPQPPGSTFKVITATAGLDAGVVELEDEFPIEVSNSLIGREIVNAHDAPCGGTFVESFASSCNTVFAPLGVDIGEEKLLEKAELFGFNEPPTLAAQNSLEALAPPASTIPEIESDVALGETAIGQGQVLATPLQMASVSQAIANDGVRQPTSLVKTKELRPEADPIEVTSPETAALMEEMMLEVVRSGTGMAAQVPGVDVAGKTGTAELGPAALAPETTLAPGEEPPLEENAWFTAYAPAEKPELAIAVMLVNATGGGGAVAAPIAQQVLASALGD